MRKYRHKIGSFVFVVAILQNIFSVSFVSAGEGKLGTCILYKKAPSGDYTKALVPSYTEAQCVDLQSEYDLIKWVEIEDIKEVEMQSKGCSDYQCSFPCLDHHVCTCAFGPCR